MAGTKNLYNSEPLDVAIEMLRAAFGVSLDRTYATVSIAAVNATTSQISVTPRVVNDFSLYADAVAFPINKLNLSARIPKDMCYSSQVPITFETLSSFMLGSYGLLILPGQWELVHNNVVYPLTGAAVSYDFDLDISRTMSLRPTVQHPLFVPAMVYPLFITDAQGMARPLSLTTINDGDVSVGTQSMVMFRAEGGVGKLNYELLEGESPLPLNADGTGLDGEYPVTGEYSFTLGVRDLLGQTAQTEVNLNVQMGHVHIANEAPQVEAGESYDHQYDILGGFPPLRVINTTDLPVGMQLSSAGLLTGRTDPGNHSFNFVVQDKLGMRAKLHDRLVVSERSSVQAHGLAEPYQEAQLTVDERLVQGWASSFDLALQHLSGNTFDWIDGYVERKLSATTDALTVSLWMAAGYSQPGQCVFSINDHSSSLELYVGDYDSSQLRVKLTVDGKVYGFQTPAEQPVLEDPIRVITVVAGEGLLAMYADSQLLGEMSIPHYQNLFTKGSQIRMGDNGKLDNQWRGRFNALTIHRARLLNDQFY